MADAKSATTLAVGYRAVSRYPQNRPAVASSLRSDREVVVSLRRLSVMTLPRRFCEDEAGQSDRGQ